MKANKHFFYIILPVFKDCTTLNFGFSVTLAIKWTEEWTGFVFFCNNDIHLSNSLCQMDYTVTVWHMEDVTN